MITWLASSEIAVPGMVLPLRTPPHPTSLALTFPSPFSRLQPHPTPPPHPPHPQRTCPHLIPHHFTPFWQLRPQTLNPQAQYLGCGKVCHGSAQDIVNVQMMQKAAEEAYGKAAAKYIVKAAVEKLIAEEQAYGKAAANCIVKAAMEKLILQVSWLSCQISWVLNLTVR